MQSWYENTSTHDSEEHSIGLSEEYEEGMLAANICGYLFGDQQIIFFPNQLY